MFPEKEIKRSFENVKKDISDLSIELTELKYQLNEIQIQINEFISIFNSFLINSSKIPQSIPIYESDNSTYNFDRQTDTSTVPLEIQGLKTQNLDISSGNKGVSTDRQTLRQTDKHTDFNLNLLKNDEIKTNSIDKTIQKAANILESFGSIQSEIKSKFKSMTPQEVLVFSIIYELEEENPSNVTYSLIANKLNLSQSSIRDYVQRIISKGIPIIKHKVNNKKVCLGISSDLKKIASLNSILRIREL